MTTSLLEDPGVEPGTDRSTRRKRIASQSERAFEALLNDPELSSSSKLVARAHHDQCWSADQAASFLSRLAVARKLGWHMVKDRGAARVKRAEAELCRHGYVFTLSPQDFAIWYQETGSKVLGLERPKARGNPRRYMILRWKRPDADPEAWSCLLVNRMRVDSAPLLPFERVDSAPVSGSTAPQLSGSNAPPPKRTSPFELPVEQEDKGNVTADRPGRPDFSTARPEAEAEADPPRKLLELSEADLAAALGSLRSPVRGIVFGAAATLYAAGKLPPEHLDKLPKLDAKPEAPRKPIEPAVTKGPAEILEDRLRRIAGRGTAGEAQTLEELAFDLGFFLADAESARYYGVVVRELARGETPLDHVMLAFRSARKKKKGEQGREFARKLQPYRGTTKKKNRPPALFAGSTDGRSQGTNPAHPNDKVNQCHRP